MTQVHRISGLQRRGQQLGLIFGIGVLSTTVLGTMAAQGAERIRFFIPPLFQLSLDVRDLEILAEQGRVTNDFSFYANFATEQQLQDLRDLLNREFPLNPTLVAEFTYTELGESLLREISTVIKSSSPEVSFHYLRGALIQAADDPGGLTILNILRRYGGETLEFDVAEIVAAVNAANQVFQEQATILESLNAQASRSVDPDLPFSPRLSRSGPYPSQTFGFTFVNSRRARRPRIPVEITLPEELSEPAPVILIAPGLASGLETFTYLEEHLASHGFATATLQFPDSSDETIAKFLMGLGTTPEPNSWVQQPLDLSALLDELERLSESDQRLRGRLDLSRVGLFGQSLGGYTVLATAGAELNWSALQELCDRIRQPETYNFNLANIWQCSTITDQPPPVVEFQEDRIKAVFSVNPVTTPIFGPAGEGLANITVPTTLVTSTEDLFAPPSPEQIFPFSQISNPNRYLLIVERGTHFSFLGGEGQGVVPIPELLLGPGLEEARDYMREMTTAFFMTHVSQQDRFADYLSPTYVQSISQPELPMRLVRSISPNQLDTMFTASIPADTQ